MKKIFLFLLAATTLVSCGDDDSSGSAKMPSSVNLTSTGGDAINWAITYDSKKRVTQINRTGDNARNTIFTYGENGKVATATITGSASGTYTFGYDDQKRLTSVTQSGQPALTLTYINDTTISVAGTTITLDNRGDISTYSTLAFSRDASKKGAFANVKFDPIVQAIIDSQTLFFASKKPTLTISGESAESYIMTNTYDSGYLSGSQFVQSGDTYNLIITY